MSEGDRGAALERRTTKAAIGSATALLAASSLHLLVAVLLLPARTARAQDVDTDIDAAHPDDPPSAAAPAAGEDPVALFDRGVVALRAERYEEAAGAFRESYRLSPDVTTMCNLALTYDRWDRARRAQAVHAYRTCAAEDRTGRYASYSARRAREIERELALEEEEEEAASVVAEEDASAGAGSLAGPSETAVAPAASALHVPPPTEPEDHGLLFASIGVAALAVAAVVPAIVLALDADRDARALRAALGPGAPITNGSSEHRWLEDIRARVDAATALYVVTGVLGATAAALLIVELVQDAADGGSTAAGDIGVAAVPIHDGAIAALRARF